jgi:Arc/MetJ family transcription regulator
MRRVWSKDAELLVKIGRELAEQKVGVTVTLPRALVTAAVRSWDRDWDEDVVFDRSKETPSQTRTRHRSGALSLIGYSVKPQRPKGRKTVRVKIDAYFIAEALRAFYDDD